MSDLVYKIILAVVLLLVIGIVGYYVGYDQGFERKEAVFCPQDVQECPGGSFVGRVPPNCEFAECPGS